MTTSVRGQTEAKTYLLDQLGIKPGDTIYTQVEHVSKSGMTRWINLYVIKDNVPLRITRQVCEAADFTYSMRYEALKIEGCGMDMGFQAVYCLGLSLWPDGTPEPHGKRNGEPDSNGGYALKQRWL